MMIVSRSLVAGAALLVLATASAGAQAPSTVLVVANGNNTQSVALANYYMNARAIPATNLLLLSTAADDNIDTCTLADYNALIATPVYAKIKTLPQIDYIVLCRNLPIKIKETTGSVDSALAGKGTAFKYNPFYLKTCAFTSAQYGIYLVTRLDGWSWDDARALVDRSVNAVKTAPFLFDGDPTKAVGTDCWYYNNKILSACTSVCGVGLRSANDNTNTFMGTSEPLGGYVSWGSNDGHFVCSTFCSLTFAPGAIAETAVSTSGSNIRFPGGSQSQIAQLIHDGLTGGKGYVAEPYLNAIAQPDTLMKMYVVKGRNLADSFYSASMAISWKDVVLGDPLCAPYKP